AQAVNMRFYFVKPRRTLRTGRVAACRSRARSSAVIPETAPHPDLTAETVALVRRWLVEARDIPASVSAERLAGVLRDPNGLAFTMGFVDGVVRPEDHRVAARALAAVAPKVPAFLPWHLRAAVRLGGLLAPIAPGIVVPIARAVLRKMVGHLIV